MLGKCADDIIGPALLLEPGVGAQVSPGIYVVRVYRRSPGRQLQIIGLGETSGDRRRARFASLAELAAILGAPEPT